MKPPPDLIGETYEAGCAAVNEAVRIHKIFDGRKLEFVMPPDGIAVIAGLGDVDLARNDAAREFVRKLVADCERQTGEHPTVLMLQVVLARHGVPVTTVPVAELGIKGKTYTIDKRAPRGSA